jgi:hypothetical protein
MHLHDEVVFIEKVLTYWSSKNPTLLKNISQQNLSFMSSHSSYLFPSFPAASG